MPRLCAALLVLTACGSPCPSERLTPLEAEAAFVAHLARDDRAALAVYDREGELVSERWLDGEVAWPGQSAAYQPGSRLAFSLPGGLVVVLSPERPFGVAAFERDGRALAELPSSEGAASAGRVNDALWLGDGRALLTRAAADDGVGDDLALVDVSSATFERAIPLAPPAEGPILPGRLASLGAEGEPVDRVLVGLALPEAEVGAIASVGLGGEVAYLALAGLSGCAEVVRLPGGTTPRAAVLCAGPREADEVLRRDRAGIVLVEVEGGSPRELSRVTSFTTGVPADSLVALDGAWVAARSPGDLELLRPDRVVAVDLESGRVVRLAEEPIDSIRDGGLGEGARVRMASGPELLWPSVRRGILRWRFAPSAAEPFVSEPALSTPRCLLFQARSLRALE